MSLEIVKGEGSYLIDKDGNRYLDLVSGLSVNALGYQNEAIKDAIEKQMNQYLHLSNYFISEPVVKLAKLLVHHSFASKVFFSNSGTEANEAALKLARKYGSEKHPDKIEVLTFTNSFHGRTYGGLSLTGQSKYQSIFKPIVPGIEHVRFNDIEDLIEHVNPNTCAFFLELIQGEGGVHEVSQEFMDILVRLAKEYDFLIIVDDIQAGMGRTGDLFSYEKLNFTPDLLTIAKSLGGGIPLGAMLVSKRLENIFLAGQHGSTFGGNPLACRVGAVVLETIIQPEFQKSVKAKGFYFKKSIEELMVKYPHIMKEVRGRGLMIGFDVGEYANRIKALALRKGLILNSTNQTVIRLLPPLTISYEEIDEFLIGLDQILEEIEERD
jgi:acetylornithine/N-succinyldiaminopimelate aminotransferase